ncbi:MAG: hypothetical protein R2698_03875 [Microthrixaceae bacterium]
MRTLLRTAALGVGGLSGDVFGGGRVERRCAEDRRGDRGCFIGTGRDVARTAARRVGFAARSAGDTVIVVSPPNGAGSTAVDGVEPIAGAIRVRPPPAAFARYIAQSAAASRSSARR